MKTDMVNSFGDFYPRSPCGERRDVLLSCFVRIIFLSTLSLRRATTRERASIKPIFDFYPRSPCGERRMCHRVDRVTACISIHALLAESDCAVSVQVGGDVYFYPRSPCGERHPKMSDHPHNTNFYPRSPCGERHERESQHQANLQFLSTLSLRRATCSICSSKIVSSYFYPRSPCGERPPQPPQGKSSIKFLSTLSLRRATPSSTRRLTNLMISIHALLAESDTDGLFFFGRRKNFYPRSPCGERLINAR